MAKKNRMSVLKRQREARKAEKAALKRERRSMRDQQRGEGDGEGEGEGNGEAAQVMTREDLESYGALPPEDDKAG